MVMQRLRIMFKSRARRHGHNYHEIATYFWVDFKCNFKNFIIRRNKICFNLLNGIVEMPSGGDAPQSYIYMCLRLMVWLDVWYGTRISFSCDRIHLTTAWFACKFLEYFSDRIKYNLRKNNNFYYIGMYIHRQILIMILDCNLGRRFLKKFCSSIYYGDTDLHLSIWYFSIIFIYLLSSADH